MNTETKENEFIMVKKEQELRLKLPLMKVLGFAPMFNNNFIILGSKNFESQTIAHYDDQGKLLK